VATAVAVVVAVAWAEAVAAAVAVVVAEAATERFQLHQNLHAWIQSDKNQLLVWETRVIY